MLRSVRFTISLRKMLHTLPKEGREGRERDSHRFIVISFRYINTTLCQKWLSVCANIHKKKIKTNNQPNGSGFVNAFANDLQCIYNTHYIAYQGNVLSARHHLAVSDVTLHKA